MLINLYVYIISNIYIYVNIYDKIRGTFCFEEMKVAIVFFFFMNLDDEIKKAPLLLTDVCSIGALLGFQRVYPWHTLLLSLTIS